MAEAKGAKLIDIDLAFEAQPKYKQTLGIHPTLGIHHAIAELSKQSVETETQPVVAKWPVSLGPSP